MLLGRTRRGVHNDSEYYEKRKTWMILFQTLQNSGQPAVRVGSARDTSWAGCSATPHQWHRGSCILDGEPLKQPGVYGICHRSRRVPTVGCHRQCTDTRERITKVHFVRCQVLGPGLHMHRHARSNNMNNGIVPAFTKSILNLTSFRDGKRCSIAAHGEASKTIMGA